MAVIVPTWDSVEVLPACIESVRAQTGVDVELLVVDNGSCDGTIELLENEEIPHVGLPRNVGFAPAVNLGTARTQSPLVLALNADTAMETGSLARLAAALSERPGVGGVQPLILQFGRDAPDRRDRAHAIVYSAGQALTRDGRGYEIGAGRRRDELRIEGAEVFGVCGAACLMRREMLSALGGYDERYFAFCEDVDLNVRGRIAGWSFRLEPDAVVWHIGNVGWRAGFRNPDAENARLVARNRLATQIKFMAGGSIPRIAAVELGALTRAARGGRFWPTLAGKAAALRWLPGLLRERCALRRAGDPERARAWLGSNSTA